MKRREQMKFYDKPDGGGSGSDFLMDGHQDIDQFIKNSKKLDLSHHPTVNQDLIDDPVDDQGNPITIPDPQNPTQPAQQQPDVTPQAQPVDQNQNPQVQPQPVQPQQPTDQPQVQQIDLSQLPENFVFVHGENQYDRNSLEQAIKDSQNKGEWQKNLTQEAQELSFLQNMDPDTRERFRNEVLLYAYKKKDYTPEEVEVPKEFEFEHTNSDNYKDTIKLPADHPIIKQAMEVGYKRAKAEFGDAFETLNQKQSELSEFEDHYKGQMAEMSLRNVISHPAIGLEVQQGAKVQDLIKGIVNAGKTHPQFNNVQRLMRASEYAGYRRIPINEALDELYGDFVSKPANVTDRKQKIIDQQRTGLPLVPGNQPPAPSKDDEFLTDLSNNASAQIAKILEGFM